MLYRNMVIRSADIGGTLARRGDIFSGALVNYVSTGSANSPEDLIDFVCADLPLDCNGIAISVAGFIKNGIVVQSPNIPWLNGINLIELAEKKFHIHTEVYNDMDGASAGMYDLLVAQKVKPKRSLCMTWSTGIGARVVDNGSIINHGAEMSHFVIDKAPWAPICGCGLQGCVESLIGGKAIENSILESNGRFIVRAMNPCEFLDQEFDSKVQWAVENYHYTAKVMAQFLAIVITTIGFDNVIYKGTFGMSAFPRVGELIKKYMKVYLMICMRSRVDEMQFIPSPDPKNDALHGSAALFREKNEIEVDV